MSIACIKLICINLSNLDKFFGISMNMRLATSDKLITSECTSFTVYKNFVIFTSQSKGLYHALYFIDLMNKDSALYKL